MLAVITSHPIQNQAPLWRAIARDQRIPLSVWFLTPHAVKDSFDPEFGHSFAWDIDLLEGYDYRFLDLKPNWRLDRFNGIRLQNGWTTELRTQEVKAIWVEGWRFSTLWRAISAAKKANIKVWLRGETHGLAPENFLRQFAKQAALSWLFRRVDRFLYIGETNRRFYLRYGVSPDKLVSTPYCVDNERFASASARLRPQRADLRSRWSIPENAWCVLFCGKLIAKKRPLDLVAAARLAAASMDRPLHLLFAGDGELAQPIRDELSRSPQCAGTLTGFLNQSEIPAAFAAADCLVLPSDYGETWGLVANEALASGLPAIVSDHCGCAENLAAPLGSFHVFPYGNTKALAASIKQTAVSPPSPAVIASIAEAHSPDRTVEQIIGLWADLAKIHMHNR